MAQPAGGKQEDGGRSGVRPLQEVLTGIVVMLMAAPVVFVPFAMSLMVAAVVIGPTAILVAAVITALVGSWTARRWVGDGNETDTDTVIGRDLAPLAIVVLHTSVTATRLAFRYRRSWRRIVIDLGL